MPILAVGREKNGEANGGVAYAEKRAMPIKELMRTICSCVGLFVCVRKVTRGGFSRALIGRAAIFMAAGFIALSLGRRNAGMRRATGYAAVFGSRPKENGISNEGNCGGIGTSVLPVAP